jgi:signal transduction histidine kinase
LYLVNAGLTNNGIQAGITGAREIKLFGFPSEFSQVMLNLIANAKDVMLERNVDAGRIDIAIDSTARDVTISVRDNAGGITRENLEKIFDPYFTTKGQGSGLGLATSFSIIKQHGGHIIAESDMGKGTTFIIYLPASLSKEATKLTREIKLVTGTG